MVWEVMLFSRQSLPPHQAVHTLQPADGTSWGLSQSHLPLHHHTQWRIGSLATTFLVLELQMCKTITFPVGTMPLDVLINGTLWRPLGWDTLWRPSAQRVTLSSSQYNQGDRRSPSRSTSELPPEFLSENGYPPSSENGYPPSGRTHPFLWSMTVQPKVEKELQVQHQAVIYHLMYSM